MRRFVLLSLLVAAISLTAVFSYAADERESKTVTPQKKATVIRLPVDPQERAKALGQILNNVVPGNGSFFMFNTRFTPSHTEQSSLRPGILLNQPTSPPYTVQGYCMIRDSSGLRARIGGVKITNNQATQIESIFAGGDRIYQWFLKDKETTPSEDLTKKNYLQYDEKGIDYFLNSVKCRGLIQGPAMEKLLKETGASRIGVENIRGTRTLVYGIQPLKADFLNSYQYLQIWVRVGDFKIMRTNAEMTFGNELTEYSRQLVGVKIDDSNFLLPGETPDDIIREYNKILNDQGKPSEPSTAKPEEKSAPSKTEKPSKDSGKETKSFPFHVSVFLP